MDFSLFFETATSRNHVGENRQGFLLDAVRFADENDFCAVWPPQEAAHVPLRSGEAGADPLRESSREATNGIAFRTVGPSLPSRPSRAGSPEWKSVGHDSEEFKAAAQAGNYVLTDLLGRSIDALAKDVALYHRVWAKSGRGGHGYVTVVAPTLVGNGGTVLNQAVREAMRAHLKRQTSLLREATWDFPGFARASEDHGMTIDQFLSTRSNSEFDELLHFSVERYLASGGLIGGQHRCLALLERLEKIGVDEIACCIDFGWPTSVALQHLPALNELRVAFVQRDPIAGDATVHESSAIIERGTSWHQASHCCETVAHPSPASGQTETQQKMAALWKRLLDVPEVDLGDNFFDLGGHSLLAARAVSEIDRTFGTSLSVKTLMVSSLSQIASEVDRLAINGHNGNYASTRAASEWPQAGRLSSYFKNAENGNRFEDGGPRAE